MESFHLEGEKSGGPGRGPAARTEPSDRVGQARPMICVRCGREITTAADRIEVDGLHEHTQINPHGFIWSFGCFAQAPGCVAAGAASREFAWFSGHSWQIEQCGGCRLHLGWRFWSEERSFHGLIVGRVVQDAERPRA